jgi:transposase
VPLSTILLGVDFMFYLGIDIAKTNHVASLLDKEGKVIIRNIKFTNSNEGYKSLLEIISSKVDDLSNVLIGMEATGHYWLSVFSSLVDDNFNVSVFNPYQIKSYRSSYSLRKQKNDVIDSIIIGDYLRVFGSDASNLPDEDILALKQLTRFRSNMVDNIASLKTQVIGILDKIFPEYESLFCDVFGVASKQILLECPTPEDIIKIKELYDNLDSHLLSVPGVGKILAPIILAEIGDINYFNKPSKLIAFAGIDPSQNQSGNKASSNEKTSKRGSPYLRHAIFTASLVAMKYSDDLRAYYDKKKSEGKHHFVALTGVSRKLLTIIYFILKEDRDYRK